MDSMRREKMRSLGGDDDEEAPYSDLPLLRKPRARRKAKPAAEERAGDGKNSSTDSSTAGSWSQLLDAAPQAGGTVGASSADERNSNPGAAQALPGLHAGAKASSKEGEEGLIGFHGDVQVLPRYLPQMPEHAGPRNFPRRPVRQPPVQPSVLRQLKRSSRVPAVPVIHDDAAVWSGSEREVPLDGDDGDGDDDALHTHNTAVTLLEGDDREVPAYSNPDIAAAAALQASSLQEMVPRPLIDNQLAKPYISSRNYQKAPGFNGPAGKQDRNTVVHSLYVQEEEIKLMEAAAAGLLKAEGKSDKEVEENRAEGEEMQDTGANVQQTIARVGPVPETMPTMPSSVLASTKAVFYDGERRHFCGQSRSHSPFRDAGRDTLSPAEAAVVQCRHRGGKRLNLKAYFMNNIDLPNLGSVANITYLNLSFNQLTTFPTALYALHRLQVLTLRDNFIKSLPDDFHRLKSLVSFSIAYNWVERLPETLGKMKKLRDVDMSFNNITTLPDSMGEMRALRSLYISGNVLEVMPLSTRTLLLKDFRCEGNLFHPVLWLDHERNQPQKLSILCRLAARQCGIALKPGQGGANPEREAKCDCCQLPLLDMGYRMIKAPRPRTHNTSKLPFLYHACSTKCYTDLDEELCQEYARKA